MPEFTRDAQKDLRSLPPRVARAALQAIAGLGAGDWRHVKQMYSSGPSPARSGGSRAGSIGRESDGPLYTVRVGIHYRALFRTDEGTLRVLRVVAREELMEVLRRVA